MGKRNWIDNWRHGRYCVFKNYVHLIFVTKYRRGCLDAVMLDKLDTVFQETCEQLGCELLECNGEADHVHLLVAVPPKVAVANLVGKLKGKSAYILRKEFGRRLRGKVSRTHLWSPSYCAVSCGGATLEVIKKYIENQQTADA